MAANQWRIIDDNGTIDSGTFEQMQFIWDLTTRDLSDLANEYRQTYSRSTLKAKIADMAIDSWTGDLELIEIHNTFK